MKYMSIIDQLCSGSWLALGLALLAGCDRGQAQMKAPPPMPPPLVTTAPVVTRDVPHYLDEIGKCTAREMVAVQPQVSGRITDIHFTDGADVKKGDLLFTIDPRPYQAALVQAQASLAESQASLNHAKLDWVRVKDLQQGVVTQEDRDNKQSAVEVADAQVQASRAAIETSKINLDYCTIKSPIDGLAGQRRVDLGNVVIANNPMATQSSLLTIQRLDPIYADFTITEQELPAVRENMAKGTLKTLVRLPSDTDSREGELSFLDNAVQDGTGTVKLRATLKNDDRHFWPGQFIYARLVLNVQKDARLVPAAAVQVGQVGAYVYVVKPDSTADLRQIVQGQRQGDMVVISEGVNADEKVIVTGQMLVMPGGKVKEVPPADASAAPSTAPSTASSTAPSSASASTQPSAPAPQSSGKGGPK